MNNEDQEQVPLLVGFSVPRTGEDTLPGHYDTQQQVWVVDGENGVTPLVEATGDLAELVTKTFAKPERDDAASGTALEIVTKTEAKPEKDDVPRSSLTALLDLVTKTKAQMERDDR